MNEWPVFSETLYWKPKCTKLEMPKTIIFLKEKTFFLNFFFLHQSKILLMFKGRENRCRFTHTALIFAWNSLNLHISVVGVCYCKGSYWRREQLPQKISQMAHTDILRESETLRRKRGIQDSTWEGRGEFFYAQRHPLTTSLSGPSSLSTNWQCPGYGDGSAHERFGEGGQNVMPSKVVGGECTARPGLPEGKSPPNLGLKLVLLA